MEEAWLHYRHTGRAAGLWRMRRHGHDLFSYSAVCRLCSFSMEDPGMADPNHQNRLTFIPSGCFTNLPTTDFSSPKGLISPTRYLLTILSLDWWRPAIAKVRYSHGLGTGTLCISWLWRAFELTFINLVENRIVSHWYGNIVITHF